MNNYRKRNVFSSRRHALRIIANNSDVDVAGCSAIDEEQIESVNIIDNDNLDLHKISCENIEEISNTYNIDYDDNIHNNNTNNISNINNNDNNNDIGNNNDIDNNANNNTINNDNETFRHAIAEWIVTYNIPHNASNSLLKILQHHTSCTFSADTRTLLKTPRQSEIIEICGGHFFYFGLGSIIKKMFIKCNDKNIKLLINIDGLPLAKSSRASLWPILCSNTKDNTVYLAGAYFGYTKPNDSNIFLEPLVNDLTHLINEGYYYNNTLIQIQLFGMICDAPAKSFVLCTKGHTGFYSCTKCIIRGLRVNGRICFPNRTTPYPLRTNEFFAINAYKDFQINYSVLNNIPNFLPITNTPLDFMHLVCLGVVKKMILLWIEGPFSVRVHTRLRNKLSHLLILLRNSTPRDFARKPRSLKDVKQWKAVEFRNFLLYIGPVVLRYILKKDMYYNFLTLHVAITILVRPNLCKQEGFINYAESLLNHFVTSFQNLYGTQYVSHNVHNLLHLCNDVRTFGSLDTFSAFRFENYMTCIKRKLRKPEKPLQQLIRRYKEIEHLELLSLNHNGNKKELYTCTHLHKNGPLCDNYNINNSYQYLQVSNKTLTITCKGANNCCILRNDIYILVLNIIKTKEDAIFLIGKKLQYVKDLYTIQCNSSQLGIKVMKVNSENINSWSIADLLFKAWKIPYSNDSNTFAIFPLNHGM